MNEISEVKTVSTTVENEVPEKKATLKLTENPDFPGNLKTLVFTSMDMNNLVNSLFKSIPDYYGCCVCMNVGNVPLLNRIVRPGSLYVDLYFRDSGKVEEGKIKCIIPRNELIEQEMLKNKKETETKDGEKPRGNFGARFARVNGANRGRVYQVTKATYEILEEFMPTGDKTRWQDFTFESASQRGIYGKEEVTVCISGLDLNRIISKIFGTRIKGKQYEYAANVIGHIKSTTQFIMQISQIDVDSMNDLQAAINGHSQEIPFCPVSR